MEAKTGSSAVTDLTAEVDLTVSPRRTDLHDPEQRAEVEAAICAIPGVLGARVVAGFDRQVDELHVLATLEKSPKQAVRDVQTVLMARFGVPTDHRVISVVQLDESDAFAPSARAIIDSVGVTQAGLEVTAEVRLRDGDDLHLGSAEGPSTASGRTRAIALATLAAIGPLLHDGGAIEFEGADIVDVLGRKLAVSLLNVRTSRSELTLSGSALVRGAAEDAVARSVLDALNRMIAETRL